MWVNRGNVLERSRPAPHPGAKGFERLSGQNGIPPQSRVFHIFESREGDVWVGMYRFLAQFPADGSRARIWSKENGLPSRGIGTLGQDRDGNLWMGTGDEGGLKLASGGILTYYAANGIGVDGVISIAETRRGELYFAGRQESEGFRVGIRSGDRFQAIPLSRVPRKPFTYLGWRPVAGRSCRIAVSGRNGGWRSHRSGSLPLSPPGAVRWTISLDCAQGGLYHARWPARRTS